MNLPNKLTVLRIILVLVMIIINFFNIPGEFLGISSNMWVLEVLFVIASITDKLDGTIARKTNQVTTFGKFLDPIADKILVITAMIILVEIGKIPGWIPIIVVLREFIVSGYRLIAVEKGGKVIAANIWGKLKTVTQMIAIIVAFIDVNSFGDVFKGNLTGFSLVINTLMTIMMIVSTIATIFSGWNYIKDGKDLLLSDK